MSIAIGALLLAAPGLHRFALTAAYVSLRNRSSPPAGAPSVWPSITVQLPIYNERFVIRRLLRAVTALRYPRDRLQIQVLDDSTDRTSVLAAREVGRARAAGVHIQHVRRNDREGLKAGALAAGKVMADGDLFVVFDADFVPPQDFLLRVAAEFADPSVGFVQVRWQHANREESSLTRAQALLLDAHFLIEHRVRGSTGRFFNFNGTAGAIRRTAIDDAGGWHSDTLTEDLDLSYRIQLAGWRGVYLHESPCPGDVPASMSDFKRQQRRWVAGAMQTARKLMLPLLASRLPIATKLEAVAHLLTNLVHPMMMAMFAGLVLGTIQITDAGDSALAAGLLGSGTAGIVLFYAVAHADSGHGHPFQLPAAVITALALGSGLAVSNSVAVLQGLLTSRGVFERTPKVPPGVRRPAGYISSVGCLPVVELVLGWGLAMRALVAARAGLVPGAAFLTLFATGTLWVGQASLRDAVVQMAIGCRSRSAACER